MASELHVDAIKHSGGTSAMTIDSSGVINMPNGSCNTSCSSADHTVNDAHTWSLLTVVYGGLLKI